MKLLKINYGVSCTKRCIDCPYYFDCTSDLKKEITTMGRMEAVRSRIGNIRYKLAVISGKGGVGKSTVSANLAVSLAQVHRVGIIDSDFDGPCIPKILGVENQKLAIVDNEIIPVTGPCDLKVVSTAFLLDRDEFNIWFHNFKRNALEEYLAHVSFGELEYLILDLPPGTSSETINIFKYLPDLAGVIVVTIPSELSQDVARRAIKLSQHAGIRVLGVVENMSGAICPDCGNVISPFQSDGGKRLAENLGVSFLGSIPLDPRISQSTDRGIPFILEDTGSTIREVFDNIVKRTVAAVRE